MRLMDIELARIRTKASKVLPAHQSGLGHAESHKTK